MKKKIGIILFGLICLLSACSSQNEQNQETDAFSEYQRGFMMGLGNAMVETPDGYYFFNDDVAMNNYLYFMDKEMKEYAFVCSKPECMHDKESMENRWNCDAYFPRTGNVNYYKGKLYVTADNSSIPGKLSSGIYELDLDGSNRKLIYTGDGEILAFCIYKGDMIIYERKYMEESLNPSTVITRVPITNPEQREILYESSQYQNEIVNNFQCYQNYCYFLLYADDIEGAHGIIINLDTKEVKDCYEFANTGFIVGKDRLYCRNITEKDNEKQTWKDEYYECSLDGEIKRKITEEDFAPLKEKAVLNCADDQYLYFLDIMYGGNAVPKGEQKWYICNYDGQVVGTIPLKNFHTFIALLPGNSQYIILIDMEPDEEGSSNKVVYYRIDKSKIGGSKELIPEKILQE